MIVESFQRLASINLGSRGPGRLHPAEALILAIVGVGERDREITLVVVPRDFARLIAGT
jgi:hypothetical protein